VQGKILLCLPSPNDQNALIPNAHFPVAAQYVVNRGGSGLIFAQYTTDNLETTSLYCQSIACVVVDLDTGKKIKKYMGATRFVQSNWIKDVLVNDGDNIIILYMQLCRGKD
jgi:hypothetical protein